MPPKYAKQNTKDAQCDWCHAHDRPLPHNHTMDQCVKRLKSEDRIAAASSRRGSRQSQASVEDTGKPGQTGAEDNSADKPHTPQDIVVFVPVEAEGSMYQKSAEHQHAAVTDTDISPSALQTVSANQPAAEADQDAVPSPGRSGFGSMPHNIAKMKRSKATAPKIRQDSTPTKDDHLLKAPQDDSLKPSLKSRASFGTATPKIVVPKKVGRSVLNPPLKALVGPDDTVYAGQKAAESDVKESIAALGAEYDDTRYVASPVSCTQIMHNCSGGVDLVVN